MINGLLHKKLGKRGFTLMEILVVVGIVAILAGIAIPSIIAIKKSLDYKRNNDYAKTIFFAVQANLTAMKENGEIEELQALVAQSGVEIPKAIIARKTEGEAELQSETDASEDGSANASAEASDNGYIVVSHDTASLLELVLPSNSIEASAWEEHMYIELNPETGNVFSVFYWDRKHHSEAYQYSNLIALNLRSDDEERVKLRKEMRLGYYEGSFAVTENQSTGEVIVGGQDEYDLDAFVSYKNGEEGIVRIAVPTGKYVNNILHSHAVEFGAYAKGLEIRVTILGENGGTITAVVKSAGEVVDNNHLDIRAITGVDKDYENVNCLWFDFSIDSLIDGGSFANLSANTTAPLSSIADESAFAILPGENVTISVDVTFTPSTSTDPIINIAGAAVAGVNPMFHSLTKNPAYTGASDSTEEEYILAVSNGRHLQNLNALAPSIASKVESVVFVTDDAKLDGIFDSSISGSLDGGEIVSLAADGIEDGSFTPNEKVFGIDWNEIVTYYNGVSNRPEDAAFRSLPGFTPIRNASLFGFDRNLAAEFAGSVSSDYAVIEGNGVEIRNLIISGKTMSNDTAKHYANAVPGQDKVYYAPTDTLTGLFGYLDTEVDGVNIVNPSIHGVENGATGALAGEAGTGARFTNCGVYLDKGTYDADRLRLYDFRGESDLYGVSGKVAVGGLVGRVRSNVVIEDNSNLSQLAAFRNCFAAVPVYGDMTENGSGSLSGVGALVGHAEATGFYGCYASGNVIAAGMSDPNAAGARLLTDNVVKHLGIDLNGDHNWGAGGFVGTGRGTRYDSCFATGNVSGAADKDDYGMGAFIGIMCYDGKCGNGVASTVFSNCYALGEAASVVEVKELDANGAEKTVQRTLREGFSGGNAVVNTGLLKNTKFYADANYYMYHALSLLDLDNLGSWGQPKDYLFKDVYHLSRVKAGEGDELIDRYSSFCSVPDTYYNMQNLHRVPASERLDTLKQLVIADYVKSPEDVVSVLGVGLSDAKKLLLQQYLNEIIGDKGAYVDLTIESVLGVASQLAPQILEDLQEAYSDGFEDTVWDNQNTETYCYTSENAYPFPVLKTENGQQKFYGEWPADEFGIGLAYFEEYENLAGLPAKIGYYFDHPDASSLQNGLVSRTDGYALLVQQNGDQERGVYPNVSVSAYRVEANNEETAIRFDAGNIYTWVDGTVLLGKGAYHVIKLDRDALERMCASYDDTERDYYTKLVVTVGNKSGTFYFNPNAALSQINPVKDDTVAQKPKEAPEKVYIRTARQLDAVAENMECFWNLHYVQQTILDFKLYHAYLKQQALLNNSTEAVNVSVRPIGSADKPFTGTYDGGYVINGVTYQLPIYCHIPGVNEDGTAGLFGVLGEGAKVSNLVLVPEYRRTVDGKQVNLITIDSPDQLANIGLLAAVNYGTIEGVDILVTDALCVAAAGSAKTLGLVTGVNSGTLTDCDILFADDTADDTDLYTSLVLAGVEGNVGLVTGYNSGKLTDCDAASAVVASNGIAAGEPVVVTMIGASAGGVVGFSEKVSGQERPELTECSFAKTIQVSPTLDPRKSYYPVDLHMDVAPYLGDLQEGITGIYGGLVGTAKSTTINPKPLDETVTLRSEINLGSVQAQQCTFGGAVGQAVDCKIYNVDVAIGKSGFTGRDKPAAVTVTAQTAAGLVAEASNLKLSDSTVDINGNLYGTDLAAGAIGRLDWADDVSRVKSTSEITNVVVTLDRAALEYISTPAVDEIAPGNFEDARLRNVIKSDKNAAGFIGLSNGKVESCHVSGIGTIYGAERSAGFVDTVNGSSSVVSGCSVSPVYYDVNQKTVQKFENNYLFIGLEPVQAQKDGYSKQAAGFVAENYSEILKCRALGIVYAESRSAGFVLDNWDDLGRISFSFANVNNGEEVNSNQLPLAADRHMVFAAYNPGYIKNSYGWATDGKLDSYAVSDLDTADHYVSCYFAVMSAAPAERTVILYNLNGEEDPGVRNYLDLHSQKALDALLDTKGQGWSYAKDEAMKTYSYNMDNLKYPYPMIAPHYGDWVEPVGVVYYEAVPAEIGSSVTTLEPGTEYLFNDSWNIGSYVFCGRGDENVTAENASVSTTELSVGDDPAIYNAVGFISTDFKLYLITPETDAAEFTVSYEGKHVTVRLAPNGSDDEQPESN